MLATPSICDSRKDRKTLQNITWNITWNIIWNITYLEHHLTWNITMASYKVTLINPRQSFTQTIEVPDTESILNEAAEHQIKIPFECVVGACATCQGKLIEGTVDQSEQLFLSDRQIAEGYVLLCVAKPTSDCTLEVDLENYL